MSFFDQFSLAAVPNLHDKALIVRMWRHRIASRRLGAETNKDRTSLSRGCRCRPKKKSDQKIFPGVHSGKSCFRTLGPPIRIQKFASRRVIAWNFVQEQRDGHLSPSGLFSSHLPQIVNTTHLSQGSARNILRVHSFLWLKMSVLLTSLTGVPCRKHPRLVRHVLFIRADKDLHTAARRPTCTSSSTTSSSTNKEHEVKYLHNALRKVADCLADWLNNLHLPYPQRQMNHHRVRDSAARQVQRRLPTHGARCLFSPFVSYFVIRFLVRRAKKGLLYNSRKSFGADAAHAQKCFATCFVKGPILSCVDDLNGTKIVVRRDVHWTCRRPTLGATAEISFWFHGVQRT